MTGLTPPQPLRRVDDLSDFRSGAEELDIWLKQFGLVNHRSNNARIFVTLRGQRVVGYYALAMAGVERATVPDSLTRGGVPTEVPVLLLARLAVDETEQGSGLGRALLKDVFQRTARIAAEVGCRALLVHARDDFARSFYERNADFMQSPTDPLHLLIGTKAVVKAVLAAELTLRRRSEGF